MPSPLMTVMFFSMLLPLFDGFQQAVGGNDLLDKFRERLRLVGLVFRNVGDHAAVKINGYLVARFDAVGRGRAFQNRQPMLMALR